MDNFKAIYKILSTLEKSMDEQELDVDEISPQALKITERRWIRYIEMLSDSGYVKDVSIKKYIDGRMAVDVKDMKLTLEGLQYLQENSTMQKLYQISTGIIDVATKASVFI